MTKSFVISDVQLLNEAYIDADGKMCMQDDEQQPIRVTIRAERKILDGISTSDIRAVADLQQAVSLNTDRSWCRSQLYATVFRRKISRYRLRI